MSIRGNIRSACLLLLGVFAIGMVRGQDLGDVPVEQPAWTQVFQSLDGSPISVGDTLVVTGSPATGEVYSKAMLDLLALRKDRTATEALPDMDIRLTLQVLAKKNPDYSAYNTANTYDSLMVVILEVGYRNGTTVVQGLNPQLDPKTDGELLVEDGHALRGVVTLVEVNTGSGYQAVQDLPENVMVEMLVEWKGLKKLGLNAPIVNSPAIRGCAGTNAGEAMQSSIAELSWGTVVGAVEYHLEWTHVDDYRTTAPPQYYPLNVLKYDLELNATRVTTKEPRFLLPLLFDRGAVVYRVRAVGRDVNDPTLIVYGPWSLLNGQGYVSAVPAATITIGTSPADPAAHDPNKNWQLTSSYAEEGKHKEVVMYADGTARERQTVTWSSTLQVPIIKQTFYDAVGRAAVDVMPVPMIRSKDCDLLGDGSTWAPIEYYNKFNQAEAQPAHPFQYLDLLTTGGTCTPVARPLDEGDGAELYYNPASLSLVDPLFLQSKYVPQALGYPYVQTEYMPDRTGRVKRKGGVGQQYQLGVGGHATRFIYGSPEQVKLDRLFGSEAPYASQCQKNITIDPNGQASATYLDGAGHTIATSLIGGAPAGMDALASAPTGATYLEEDLFGGEPSNDCDLNHLDLNAGTLTFEDVITVPMDGMMLRLDYEVTPPHFVDPCLDTLVCYHCVYELEVRVTDAECGVVQYEKEGIVGRFNVNDGLVYFDPVGSSDCTQPEATTNWIYGTPDQNGDGQQDVFVPWAFTGQLKAGTYIVTKRLKVLEDAREQYAADYAGGTHLRDDCFASLDELTDSVMATVDTMDCYISCDECVAALGPQVEYVLGGGTAEEWQALHDACVEPCREESWCTIAYGNMLSDMRPGGQYATYTVMPDQSIQVNDPTSVFRWQAITSSLYLREQESIPPMLPGVPLWKQPRLYNEEISAKLQEKR